MICLRNKKNDVKYALLSGALRMIKKLKKKNVSKTGSSLVICLVQFIVAKIAYLIINIYSTNGKPIKEIKSICMGLNVKILF